MTIRIIKADDDALNALLQLIDRAVKHPTLGGLATVEAAMLWQQTIMNAPEVVEEKEPKK